MRKAIKNTLSVATSLAIVAGLVSTPSLVTAWGDNAGERRGYTRAQIEGGILGDNIVLNSIIDGEFGSEKNFVGARVADGTNLGADNVWEPDEIIVEEGQEYYVRAFVHNNNPGGERATAEDVRVAFSIPNVSAKTVQVNGIITASNATPSKYWDYVNFKSDRNFHLEYVYDSAVLENNGIGSGNGVQLSNNIVLKAASENGVQIGYSALNGRIPGCYAYSGFVGIKVRVVFDEDEKFTVNTNVKIIGVGDRYVDSIEAQPGDRVQFETEYRNTSDIDQHDVMIRTILPEHLRYVNGTTKLYNPNHPNGILVDQNTIAENGINIGDYGPNARAIIRFTAEVVNENTLDCGSNTLVDWTQAWVGETGLQDYASVVVNKACTPAAEHEVRVDYVDVMGRELARSYRGNFQAGDHYRVVSPEIEGYETSDTVIEGEMGNADIHRVVVYSQVVLPPPIARFHVRVRYAYLDGTQAAPSVEETVYNGESVRIESPVIEGYTPNQSVVEFTDIQDNHDVVVIYTPVSNPDPDPDPTPDPDPDPTPDPDPDPTPDPTPSDPGTEQPDDPTPHQPTAPSQNDPAKPSRLPSTGPLSTMTAVAAAGSVVTAAGYYAASRRNLRRKIVA